MLDKNMDMDNCIFKYVKDLNLLNKSEATIKSYVSTLQKFVKDEKINEVSEFVNMDKEFWFNWVNKQKDEDNISVEYNSNEYSCSNFTKKDKYDVGGYYINL